MVMSTKISPKGTTPAPTVNNEKAESSNDQLHNHWNAIFVILNIVLRQSDKYIRAVKWSRQLN